MLLSDLKLEEEQRNPSSEENRRDANYVDETDFVTESSNDDMTQENTIRHTDSACVEGAKHFLNYKKVIT